MTSRSSASLNSPLKETSPQSVYYHTIGERSPTALLSNLDFDDLLERKARYIKELQLEKAQEVEKLIQEKKTFDYQSHIKQVEDYLEEKIIGFFEIYQTNCSQISKNHNDTEIQIRNQNDIFFVEMKNRQISDLTDIMKARAYELVFQKNRPVQKAIDLENRARTLATKNNFVKAFEYKEMAHNEFELEHRTRKEEIEARIKQMKDQLFEKMRAEMKILYEKLNTQLDHNNKLLKNELEMQLRQFKVSVQSETQKAIFKLCFIYKDLETKKEITEEINRFVEEKVQQITKIEISVSLSPANSPQPSPIKYYNKNNPNSHLNNNENNNENDNNNDNENYYDNNNENNNENNYENNNENNNENNYENNYENNNENDNENAYENEKQIEEGEKEVNGNSGEIEEHLNENMITSHEEDMEKASGIDSINDLNEDNINDILNENYSENGNVKGNEIEDTNQNANANEDDEDSDFLKGIYGEIM